MRVLTFLHSFEPGGVERVALRLVSRWRADGVDAPLFMGRADGALQGEVAANLRFVVPRQPRIGSAWWETLWMIATLPGHIRKVIPDVLFCAGNTYTIVAVALKLILGRRCPPVVAKLSNDLARVDLPIPARALWRVWLRIQAKFIDRWIVMDAAILDDVAVHLGQVALTVIPDPAIDRLPPTSPARGKQEGTRYVAVGRLVHQKDHATMIRAFANIAQCSDVLTIVGDGPLRARLEQQAIRLGVAAQIVFAGHVPNAAASMRDHDVLLLSSRYEGVPAVLVEALSAGLRVVATDCSPGVRAMLGCDGAGRLPPPGDVEAFAAAITRAVEHPFDVASARQRMALFTLEAAAPHYLDAFKQALTGIGEPLPSQRSRLVERAT